MDVQKFVIKFLQFCDELNDDVLPLFLTKNEKTDLQEFNSFLSQFNEQICINVQFYNQFIENFNWIFVVMLIFRQYNIWLNKSLETRGAPFSLCICYL